MAVARALVNKPKLILADEPTGNLDSEHGDEVMKMLLKLNARGHHHPDGHALGLECRLQQPRREPAGWACGVRASSVAAMKGNLQVVLRMLRREKLYAAINIAGLSLGIACCLILGLFLRAN